jgi:pyruvate/2-oxoglutarate dehydrogenase complex dihydrolipoamide dehydrogenase (E3) component
LSAPGGRRATTPVRGWRDEGQVRRLDDAHVQLVRGDARLVTERVVEVVNGDGGSRLLTARHAIVVATGSSPKVTPIPGPVDAAPWTVIFTSPQVADVGLTEDEGRGRFRSVRSVEHDLAEVAGGSLHADGYAGSGKLVIAADRNVIVGASIVGPDVGELLHAATSVVVGEVPIGGLQHAVPTLLTISEVWWVCWTVPADWNHVVPSRITAATTRTSSTVPANNPA